MDVKLMWSLEEHNIPPLDNPHTLIITLAATNSTQT